MILNQIDLTWLECYVFLLFDTISVLSLKIGDRVCPHFFSQFHSLKSEYSWDCCCFCSCCFFFHILLYMVNFFTDDFYLAEPLKTRLSYCKYFMCEPCLLINCYLSGTKWAVIGWCSGSYSKVQTAWLCGVLSSSIQFRRDLLKILLTSFPRSVL